MNRHINTKHENSKQTISQTEEFKCDQCKYEAESIFSLNLHRAADHKVQVKNWYSKA